MQRVDVCGESERDHIGLEPVDHTAGLFTRATVRLFDNDYVASLGFPMRSKCGV